MFYESEQYPVVQPLQTAWQTLRDELQALNSSYFVKWPERSIYDGNWTVFALYRLGETIAPHTQLCPQTAQLLAQVPGLVNAGFSSLAPGTYIGPHVGYTKEVLRCHIGLITPENCALRVDKETRGWTPGSCFIFDDTQEHEAWNRSNQTRVVLLFDFKRDPSAPLSQLPDDIRNYNLVNDA